MKKSSLYLSGHFLQRFPRLYFLQHFFKIQHEKSPKGLMPFGDSVNSHCSMCISKSLDKFILQS